MKVIITCPLGSECEEAKDGAIHRCAWYCKLAGQTPDGEMVDEWRCAMAWLPTTTLETARTNRGQTQAMETFNGLISKKVKELT
ncbi:MAG: hypothetical protein DRP45_00975 [Candidatus Zixiibacteriota bacterium]|nr:MAG: hypothetical protein DRP45_00975 [candidate division Zixibacteria bacterium]